MDTLVASADFRFSYLEYDSYPLNLTRSATRVSAAALQKYKTRFDDIAADLCLEDENYVDLPIRDLYGTGKGTSCTNFWSTFKLIGCRPAETHSGYREEAQPLARSQG